MDDCYDTVNPVGIRIGEQLYNGRIHPYPVGNCRYHTTGQSHSRPESHIAKGGMQ